MEWNLVATDGAVTSRELGGLAVLSRRSSSATTDTTATTTADVGSSGAKYTAAGSYDAVSGQQRLCHCNLHRRSNRCRRSVRRCCLATPIPPATTQGTCRSAPRFICCLLVFPAYIVCVGGSEPRLLCVRRRQRTAPPLCTLSRQPGRPPRWECRVTVALTLFIAPGMTSRVCRRTTEGWPLCVRPRAG